MLRDFIGIRVNRAKKSGMVNITSSFNSRERSGINTILHELNPLFTINVTMRDIKSKNVYFFFQAEDGIRDADVTGVQTCALPISAASGTAGTAAARSLRACSRYAQGEGGPVTLLITDGFPHDLGFIEIDQRNVHAPLPPDRKSVV